MYPDAYFLTEEQVMDFRVWLTRNNLNMSKFAKLCGVSRQYIKQILDGKFRVTHSVKETFARGGYSI